MTARNYRTLVENYKAIITNELKCGKIHINKDGYYKKSINYGICNLTGKRIKLQGEGKTIEACAESLVNKIKKQEEKIIRATKALTFQEVAEEWYETDVKYSRTSDKNKENYYRDLHNHILPKLGHYDISIFNHTFLQQFLNTFYGKGESMVKKIRITVTRVMKFAMKNNYIPYNYINLVMPNVEEIKERKPLTEDLIKLLVKAQKNYPQAYTFVAMLATGLRPCEAYEIRYSDIDFEKKRLYVPKSKTENGIRVVPVPDYVLDLINTDKKTQEAKGYKLKYVFHQAKNPTLPLTSDAIQKMWKTTQRYMEIANGAKLYRNKIVEYTLPELKQFDIYNLRHTYCTMLTDEFIDGYFIKRLMGHSLKNDITQSTYSHSIDEKVIEAAQPFIKKISKIFDEAQE